MAKHLRIIVLLLSSSVAFAQSDVDKFIRSGELLLGGLAFFKAAKSNPNPEAKTIGSICVKNKLAERIIYRITPKDTLHGAPKELVIPAGGKECMLDIVKGIYIYEILIANDEVYKKGEFLLNNEAVIAVKD